MTQLETKSPSFQSLKNFPNRKMTKSNILESKNQSFSDTKLFFRIEFIVFPKRNVSEKCGPNGPPYKNEINTKHQLCIICSN